MSIEEDMPLCPTAIVVAKPKRSRWCLEEAWDLATVIGGNVIHTKFEGVFIISSKGSDNISRIREAVRNYKFSFASRLVIPRACIRINDVNVETWFEKTLEEIKEIQSARLIVALRGSSKRKVNQSLIINILYKNNIKIYKKGFFVVDIEGIDDLVIVSWGKIKKCGYNCILVG